MKKSNIGRGQKRFKISLSEYKIFLRKSQWARFSRPAAKEGISIKTGRLSNAVGAQCRFIIDGLRYGND